MGDLTNSIFAGNRKTQYDAIAKKILSRKSVMAILVPYVIREFNGLTPEDVLRYIEGDVFMNVPADPGLTNRPTGDRLVCLNTEDLEIYEGLIRFDILFYLVSQTVQKKIIVNVEIQKDRPSNYKLFNRSVYYSCRMISSQKERDFAGMNYDDIKDVYSVWICMNMPEDSTVFRSFKSEKVLGNYSWDENPNILNVCQIGISKEVANENRRHPIHRLLGILFTNDLKAEDKLEILEQEYGLAKKDFRKDVTAMCNLAEGLIEENEERIAEKALKKGRTIEDVADFMGFSVKRVQEIAENVKRTSVKQL